MSADSPVAPFITYHVQRGPTQKEWNVSRDGTPQVRFEDTADGRGATGLAGAISWCYRSAEGRSSLVIVDEGKELHRIRLHSEPDNYRNASD